MGALLNALNFFFYESNKDLCADIFVNPDTEDKIVLCMMNQDYRQEMYRQWIEGEEEKITPGLNLRYLYDKDFKDWALSRGEWSGRAQKNFVFQIQENERGEIFFQSFKTCLTKLFVRVFTISD